MATASFLPNPAGLAEILNGPGAKGFLREAAEAGAAAVRAANPSADEREQIRVGVSSDGDPAVVTDSSFWHLFEYGSVNNPPYRPFARGLSSVRGIRYEALGRGG